MNYVFRFCSKVDSHKSLWINLHHSFSGNQIAHLWQMVDQMTEYALLLVPRQTTFKYTAYWAIEKDLWIYTVHYICSNIRLKSIYRSQKSIFWPPCGCGCYVDTRCGDGSRKLDCAGWVLWPVAMRSSEEPESCPSNTSGCMKLVLEIGNLLTEPIGYLESCFSAKNGTPRQPSICRHSRACLRIRKSIFNNPEHSLMGLEEFSHVW